MSIASRDEKIPFFNQYTRWMALEKVVTKSGQEPSSEHVLSECESNVSFILSDCTLRLTHVLKHSCGCSCAAPSRRSRR